MSSAAMASVEKSQHEFSLRQHTAVTSIMLGLMLLVAVFPGTTGAANVITADGFREPMSPGCWGCGGVAAVTLGTIQYGVTGTDSQTSTTGKSHTPK